MKQHQLIKLAFAIGHLYLFHAIVIAEPLPSRSCEAWNTARKANLSTAVQREWLFGYVNGWRDAQLAQTGQDIYLTMPSVEVLLEKTNTFCEAQRQGNVGQSVTKLLNTQP